MNKLKFIAGFLLVLVSFTYTACDIEPIDPALNPDDFGGCTAPVALQAGAFNNNTVTLTWTPGGDETAWTVEYGVEGFVRGSGTTVVTSNTTIVITGLNSSNSYDFYVKSNCTATSSSNWAGPATVEAVQESPTCPNPGNITATRDGGTNTNVNLVWVAGNTETQWDIQFGVSGFALGSGTIVTSSNTTATITGIATTNSYDFYVRAKCSATENSGWIGPKVVTSVGGGPTGTVPGTYKLTAFNTSVPTDLNNDGTPHTNQMDEVTCFNNSLLFVNANATYVAQSKGVELDISGGVDTYICFTDPDDTGSWILNGNQLTFTSTDTSVDPTTFLVNGNTLSYTIPAGSALDTDNAGAVVTITCDLTLIYTKQ